ncbi:MAG TPA: O-antigen ligase family protein [Ktedonobacterales bacterium]|nr:O-antigen ligase family protein [Ktedonobacterales bacterium]
MRAHSVSEAPTRAMWLRRRRALPALAMVAALAAWYLTPWPALALVWATVFAALSWRWPRMALALAPLTFPFWYAPLHVTGRLAFPLSELTLAILALVAVGQLGMRLARLRSRRANRMARAYLARLGSPVALGAALLLAGMTVGVLIARQPQPALRAWRWEIVEPLVYAALVVWWLRGRWLWWTAWAFVASGALVAALALAQVTFAHVTFAPLGAGGGLVPYPGWNGPDWRATAIIYGSPNSAGAWMARALPLALALMLWPRAAGRLERALAALAVATLVIGMALTGSRGAWLGATAGVVVVVIGLLTVVWRGPHPAFGLAPFTRGGLVPLRGEGPGQPASRGIGATSPTDRQPNSPLPVGEGLGVRSRAATSMRLLAIVLAAALLYGASSIWLAPLVGLAGGTHGGSGEVRLLVWQAAQTMARDHPIVGVGPDQFLYCYDPRYTNHPYLIASLNGHATAAAREPNLSHPHNLGLELWLSAGLAGLAGYILALIAAARRGWRAIGRGWRGAVAVGALGALAAGLAHGLVDSAYFQPDYALAFWWGVAALIALGSPSPMRRGGRG